MDYSPKAWKTMQTHGEKVPFYMTFPSYESSDAEKEYEQDYMKIARYLPKEAALLMPFVEEECDKLEYEGSMMYDESPDKEHFLLVCRRIAAALEKARMTARLSRFQEEDANPAASRGYRAGGVLKSAQGPALHTAVSDAVQEPLIQAMLAGEMYRRRCRHRRCCRWW